MVVAQKFLKAPGSFQVENEWGKSVGESKVEMWEQSRNNNYIHH